MIINKKTLLFTRLEIIFGPCVFSRANEIANSSNRKSSIFIGVRNDILYGIARKTRAKIKSQAECTCILNHSEGKTLISLDPLYLSI
jgi:hypothetical protein